MFGHAPYGGGRALCPPPFRFAQSLPRILELLRLTDPNQGSEEAVGVEVEPVEQDDKVPEEAIEELERRVVATEVGP